LDDCEGIQINIQGVIFAIYQIALMNAGHDRNEPHWLAVRYLFCKWLDRQNPVVIAGELLDNIVIRLVF
jgi:hypothetical protein